jgi:hypothetical protein
MISEAGTVVARVAANCSAKGRVASDLSVAKAKPISALVVIISVLAIIMSAWQIDSRNTFFFMAGTRSIVASPYNADPKQADIVEIEKAMSQISASR